MSRCFDDFTCLVDGTKAFPEILSCIDKAEKSIYINMFIWRDDRIGNAIAKALLKAARRGVKIVLSIDRVAAVLEGAEEYCCSFFHRKFSPVEQLKIVGMKLFYPELWTKRRSVDKAASLYKAIVEHPNITVSSSIKKADHSKYYIFDDEILILGGINIEDKENGSDIKGRVYQDYMVKMCGKAYVDELKNTLKGGKTSYPAYGFAVNSKDCEPNCFMFEKHYMDMINEAKEELLIVMAYFAPPKAFLEEILAAYHRGVKVTFMLPADSNMMGNASKKALKRLMKATNNGIELYLSPKMLHTKLIANEKRVSMGSANMMKNTFKSLAELNLYFQRSDHAFCQKLFDSIAGNISIAQQIKQADELHVSPLSAVIEGLFI